MHIRFGHELFLSNERENDRPETKSLRAFSNVRANARSYV